MGNPTQFDIALQRAKENSDRVKAEKLRKEQERADASAKEGVAAYNKKQAEQAEREKQLAIMQAEQKERELRIQGAASQLQKTSDDFYKSRRESFDKTPDGYKKMVLTNTAQSLRSGKAVVGKEGKKASEVIGDFDGTAAKIYDDQNIKGQKIIGFSGMFGGGSLTAPSKKRPNMGYSESIDRTMFDIVDKLPTNERGEYLINGIPYKREEVWSMLRPDVEQSLSLSLLNDYAEYRDPYAQKLGYKSMDDMLSQYDARLAEIEKDIRKSTADKYPQNVNLVFPEAHVAMNLARGATAETEGLRAVRDARDQIAAMRKGDFTSGLAEGFDFGNFLTFGLSGLISDINTLRTLNKVKDGKELSASEQNMYNVFALQSELNSLDESMGTSFWRGVGQGVGFTAEMAPQFVPGMNIAGSLFKASNLAVKAGIRLSRNIARKNVWKGVARGAWEVMGKPAYNLLKAQGAGLIASLPLSSTWSNYVGKRTEQFKVVNGQLEYTPTKAWKDLFDTLAESSSEISSELAGGFINDIVGGTFKQFGKRLGIEKIGSKIGLGKNADYILGFKKSDAFKAFERNLGFQGFIGEPLSEIWGDVTSNILKMAVTGNGNLEMLKDPTYWAQALMVSTIYGGSLQLLNAPERISYYNDVRELGKKKADILSKIEDKELHDTLIKLGSDESLNVSAQELANLAWYKYNVKDIARAMDYIRAEAILQVAMGYNEQNMHLAQFTAVARKLEESAYRGVDGKGEVGTESVMYQLITPEGKRYDIISGDVTNVTSGDDLLMAIDAEGNKTTVAKQEGNRLAKSTVAEETRKMYVQMFSTAEMQSLVEDVENTYESLEKPTKEDVVSLMSRLAIVLPEQGGKITLVDDREGYFIDMTDDGQLLVEFDTPNGVEMKSVPFYSILSSADHIAEAQKLSLADKTVDTAKTELEAEVAADANAIEPTAEATEPTTATDTPSTRYAVGEIIDTPNGKGRIIAVTNGKYGIDHNLENTSTAFDVESMDYAEYGIEEIDGTESSTQPTEAEAQPTEQAQETLPSTAEAEAEVTPEAVEAELDKVSDVKTIPTNKDGSVNYDAIDDAKLYAELFAKDMGNKEAAAEAVANMRNAEAESVKKIEKASKKASSANQIVANKKKLDATKQRIAFYDDVLAELTRSEEAIPDTAEVVTPTEEVQPTAETIEPSVREVAEQVAETPTDMNERASLREDDGVVVEPTVPTARTQPTTKAGLVKNDLSAKLTDRLQKTLDAMAQAMGVTVTFVDREITTASGGKANARIIGNQVEISWKHRSAAIRFLMGHEFTHRMKDLSLEAYVAFEQSVKEYLGEEEWNKRVEKLRSLYKRQRVSISDELAAEEVTADFVGDMAYDEQTFDKYVESNKENTGLLASIARIFRSIADFFRNIGDKAHAKRLDNMTKKLDALIAASSEAVANGAQSEAVRYSISATELAEIEAERKSIIKEAKANGTYLKAPNGQPTNLTPKQWVEVRTKRFKAWFGDWELAEIAEYLMSDDVVAILSGEEFTKDGTPLTKKVSEFYEENFNGKVMRKGLGEVILDKRSVKDSTIHGFGKAKTAAFAAVPNIITEGRIIDEQKNWKGRNYDSVTIAAPIRIGGSNYVGIVIVRKGQGTNSNRFYLHEVVLQENLQDESFKTDTKADSHRGDIAKVMQKIFISKVNTSKIVDANGEPKVVYHRTPNKFTTFDVDKIGSSSDFGAFGRGFYFSPFKEQYRLYGKYLIPAFLNVRNPFNLNSENLYDTKMSFGMSPEGIQRGWTRKVSEEFTQWLKDNGYDGVVYKTDYNEEEDVVFNPNQIKSATENVGTYDANNPDIRYSLREPIFYSNAEYAVRGIKQEKATPEQWLKMIEKNGGLKAGEDKWLGLSDWLKASDNKTLTKDEVLQYIAENDIQIEEVSYGDVADISREEIYESAEFAELREGLTEYDEDDNPYINRERYDELRSESYDFVDGFSLDYWGEELEVDSPAAAASYLGLTKADNEINETRLQYTTDGLTNKREIALVVPTIEPWNTSDNIHFGDAGEGRAIAWIRFGETWAYVKEYADFYEFAEKIKNKYFPARSSFSLNEKDLQVLTPEERTEYERLKNIKGNIPMREARNVRVLVIDEIQSKRHQEGREKGYKTTEDELNIEDDGEVLIATYNGRKYFFARGTSYESIASSLGYEASLTDKDGVPPAPFEKNWAELAMKRMLRYAAENGFDKVAWTTGDQQADRYDLSEKVDSIIYKANDNGTYRVSAQVAGRGHMLGDEIPQQELSNYVGKELADRIINSEGYKTSVSVPWPDSPYEFDKTKVEEWNALSGGDLKVGGEGMKAFYDQMLPSFVRKYAKKWGATVGEVTMPNLEENNTMHSVDVTDAMRESVMQGQPKFSLRSDVADILNDYDNDGVKYGSMLDVADGIEGLIAESTEDTTELENILNDFRAAQDDARRWGNRMDSGGEDEFEEALRAYASQNEARYSLSNRPTGLLNDFADEFESLHNEYASLDPTTIHAQHPFRIRKRKVVQKYLNYVSEVLGHNVENIVYDKTNNSHVKKLYDKLKPHLKGFKEEDYSVLVESLRNRKNQASYIVGSNIIIYEISNETSFMDTVNTLRAYIHENIHRIIKKLGVDEKTLEDILEEGLLLKPDITQSYIANYLNDPKHEQGEETLAYAIGDRMMFSKDREKLLNAIEGKITAKELFGNQKISVPLRDSYIEKIVNELHNEYESRKEGEDSTGADSANREEVDKVDNQGLWRGYFGEEPVRRGGGERRVLTPTRYSVRNDDMPFFDDGGDVVIFDDLEDAPAEYISLAQGKPRITEETLSTFIKGRHHEANMRIRKETDDMKKAVKARYLDEKRKRLDGIANARTNSGKVAVILGDNAVETLSLEDQALVMIAEGDVHIVWDADKNGRKGLAGELGLSNAERKNYKSITKGATVTFEKFVHQWYESIGGYEKGIDTQDMRNALIEALSEAPTAKRAIEILRDKYDSAQREYEDAIYDIEASEERELANEEARYKQELEDINDPAKRRAYVRHYEQSVAFFDDMSGVQHTVRELERKISRLTRDAAVAQRRYERRVEAIKERNKNYTQERLDKQFERNKAYLRKVLDERNEKLRELAEGINEAKKAIKETLQGSKAIKYNSREVQSLITSIDAVRTAEGLKKVYSKAERIILNAGIRQARNDMQRLLNMRLPNGQMVESWVGTQVREGRLSAAVGRRIIADMWRGTNSRGVTVSKFVDEETAKVMKCLRDELVTYKQKDAEGKTIKVLPEKKIDAAILKRDNDMRIAELEAKVEDGTLTLVATRTADGKHKVSERTELDARRLYDSYLNVVDYKQQIEAQNKAIEEQRELIATQREGVESGEIDASVPKKSYRTLSTMYEALNDLKKSYFDKIAEFNTKVQDVLSNGRDALKEFREAQEQHRVEVIRMGLDAIGGTRVSGSPTAWQKAKAAWRGSFHNSYWTFQTTLREIDRFAPNGEGEFYNYFMRMSNKATDEFISMQHAHLATLGTYIHSLWPELSKKTAYYAFIEIMEKANTTALPTITVYERIDKDGIGHEPIRHAMCISNAMYVIAMWNQAQYKEAMQKRGITQEVINNLEAAIAEVDDRYLEFMKLVIGEMLPATRLEYDKVHRQLFGASMENIDNYFPAKIKREYLQEDMQVAENTLPSTITGSIISRRASNAMPDIMQSFFAVLEGHLQNMDNWASTAPLIMDMQTLLSNAKFRDLLNAYMPGTKNGYGSLSEIFRKACAIRAGVYKSRQAVSDDILLGMTKGFATANISFRISTAIKQLSAAPMFAAYVADPRCAKIWAKHTWKGPLIRGKKMIEAAAEISPAFRERWESKTMGSEVLARKSREAQYGVDTQDIGKSKTRKVAEDSIDLLKKAATEVGMYPNVYVDAWVCATGVLTIYEYELSRMTNGKPEEATEEMKAEARYKAETFMNATQQSADSAFLSEVQMQRSLVTSGITMYMNASYALHRLRLAGFQELGKQMFNKEYREAVREKYGKDALGDARKKAIYQIIAGVLGDVNFYLMGLLSKSMWALLSGGEDDEDDTPIWDWWEILKDLVLTMGLNGYVGGGSLSSYFQGYELNVAPAINELFKDLEKIPIWKKDEDGEKSWDGVNMWAAASIIAKFGFGVDPDTILNIILGVEGIIKQEGWEAGMKLFNEPQSAINLVAGRRRKGETVQEYVDRRMRLEVIGSVPSYEEMFDEDGKFIGQGKLEKGFDWGFFKLPVGGAKDYKVRNLFKEFNERQKNAVMRHVMTPTQRADIERTNEVYAKVCADLGWKTTADPDDKGVDKTQKRYVYPQGLSAGKYKNLKKRAREISDIRKELNKFVGSDEGYAEKLQKQHELKNKLIDKYDEFK